MAFKVTKSEPLPQLVELTAKFADREDGGVELRATLHIQPNEVEVDDEYTIEVRFKSALLCLEPDNLDPDTDSYHGLRFHSERTSNTIGYNTTATQSQSGSVNGRFGAELGISSNGPAAKIDLGLGGSSDKKSELTVARSEQCVVEQIPVEYVNNYTWRVSPQQQSYLRGNFLHDNRLCIMRRKDTRPNLVGATLHFTVKRHDIAVLINGEFVSEKGSVFNHSRNKKALLDALVAKRLREHCKQKAGSDITFSTTEGEDEG